MTDRGIKVRWTTAALVAPAAAALFTGSTVWASGHQPATASTTAKPATPAAKATLDPMVLALRTAVDANTAQVAKLRTTVASLQAQAAAIAKGAGARVAASSGGSSSTTRSSGSTHTASKSTASKSTSSKATSTKSSSSSTKKKTSSAPAPAAPAAAPAPAPASNASTGASGAVK